MTGKNKSTPGEVIEIELSDTVEITDRATRCLESDSLPEPEEVYLRFDEVPGGRSRLHVGTQVFHLGPVAFELALGAVELQGVEGPGAEISADRFRRGQAAFRRAWNDLVGKGIGTPQGQVLFVSAPRRVNPRVRALL